MPAAADWRLLMGMDPEDLGDEDEKICDLILMVKPRDLKADDSEKMIQLFRISQTLLRMKLDEIKCAYEVVDSAGAEQARIENELKAKVLKLESELEMAQRVMGGGDKHFLRDEIRQLESHLERKEKEVTQLEKEMGKERKSNEELALRAEEAEEKNRKLKRENEQLQQDIEFYRKEAEQRESLQTKEESNEIQRRLTKANQQLYQCMEELQHAEDMAANLRSENEHLQKNLEESVKEMEKMTDEYNKMKIAVQQTDAIMDQLRKDRDHAKLQVRELTDQIQARVEEDDPVMAAVNAKVEEWKSVLSGKDLEILEYQQMIRDLREKLRTAQMDSDKSNIIALQQVIYELCGAVQERDNQIKMLSEQVEQYTTEMERNAMLIEELKRPLKKDKGHSSDHQRRLEDLSAKLQVAERKVLEAQRAAQLAERDARDKDKELNDTLSRIRLYESGTDGLEAAISEIKECKNQIRVRDREIEGMIKEINQLEMKINNLLDENEDLRERLGLNPKEELDLSEFRRSKILKQRQYKAENQVLLKEIERLEEERLELKQRIRALVKDKGVTVVSNSLLDNSVEEKPVRSLRPSSGSTDDEIKRKNERLQKELSNKEKELELRRSESTQFKAKLNEMLNENKQLEQGMKEILQAIQDTQKKTPTSTGVSIPSLERLVNALEMKYSEGKFDASLHLRTQVDQLTGRNEELRQEMKTAREEAANTLSQLTKANEKIARLESEMESMSKSTGSSIPHKTLALPEEMTPTSAEAINALNEYTVQLLQEIKNKGDSIEQLGSALEEYKRKFAVIRHQQGLLYKEHQSERESWQKERDSFAELKSKLEEQREVDAVKIKEYNHLLETLEKDPSEIRREMAETGRKIVVLRVNEKCLTRRYTTLLELEQHLRKENAKLKEDFTQMQAAVTERIGYLQRFKEMAAFKMASLQKSLDVSVPASELERANKQYTELTIKYRNLLQKDNHLVQKTTSLEHLETENMSLRERIDSINKELEISKEKLHTLEQAFENISTTGGEIIMDKATKAVANSEIVSVSRRITTLEMKELNERQRAEHAQKMYEHLRNSLKQVEERNFELETKFAELTKLNLEAQRIERELRDELADSVSKHISDADRKRITELEKTEANLRIEVSKLREVSDVAKMQVSALDARQQSREKEVESLRRQVLDYQAESDEKALIAKLHQHIVALQLSETTAISRLEATNTRLQKLEAQKLRDEQKLDEQQQALWHARQEGHQRARHLRHTIQALRRQFSGALPLAQQEKFSNTMLHLQEDRARVREDAQITEEERRKAEGKAQELELKLKGLEELIATLKDAKGAQKVSEWHKKLEDVRLLEMRQSRELNTQREEIKYLKNCVAEQERTISGLEEELVQQNNLLEERQLIWDQREVQLERQLDSYEKQQNEVLNTAQKFEEATGSLPDPNQPLANQLDYALGKIKEHVRTILETKTTCKILEEKLKEKEAALWSSEQNVLSRDKVINELRLRLPAAAEREKLLADLSKQEDSESQPTLKVAHQTINNLQGRLDQKEEVLKKYQNLLGKARQEQEEIAKRHEEEVRALHQKLDVYMDTSLDRFKQTALELIKKPTITVPTSKHLVRLAEMEQTVAEQDNSLSSLSQKLKIVTQELDQQRQVTAAQAMEHAADMARLEDKHAAQMKGLSQEAEELRAQLIQMEKELHYLRTELEAQKEANVRSPSNTMKNLVERLKNQLALKEKQLKALSKALLELRAELTSQAEQQIITNAAQKEEALNVQQIVDKQTKELRACVRDLNEELQLAKDGVRAAKARENSLKEDLETLNKDLQRSQKSQNKLQSEKEALEEHLNELKKKIQRLSSGLQAQVESDGPTVDALQKKIRKLEHELDRKSISEPADKRSTLKEDKSSKEEVVRWEEGKKWQARVDKMRNVLKEKEREVDSQAKQLATMKELYSRLEQEKVSLQKKLKGRGVTADQVVGARTLEADKEIEELHKRNAELEQQIKVMKQQQALPRDAAMEDITNRNRYLEERLYSMESRLSKEPPSRPSDRHSTSPSQLSWSSKVRSMTFDVIEAEQTQSSLLNSTVVVTEKEISVIEDKATQTSFRSIDMGTAEVNQDDENVAKNKIDLEQKALMKDDKTEQEESNKEKGSVEKDEEQPDETQRGQDVAVFEYAQEELKTNDEAEELESELTHREMMEKPLDEDQLEVENEETNAEEMLYSTMNQAELETPKVLLEGDEDYGQEPEELLKCECDPSAESKELDEEETALSNSTTFDAKLVSEQPAMEKNKSFTPEAGFNPNLSEVSTSRELNANTENDILGHLKAKVTRLNDKEHSMKSKARKTSGRGSDTPSQREHEFQKENLRLSTENLELRFQLEQANKDLPRLKDQVSDLKEMCSVLKKEKAEVEKRLNHLRGSGRSGKTIPELEKTIGLMKKVVEKVQRENENLKRTSEVNVQEQLATLERDHEKLKSEYEKLKGKQEEQLNSRLESKTKGIEKIMMENERLRKEIKKEAEAAEKLRVAKASLEVANEKLKAELEETHQRLLLAQSKGATLLGVDSKTWKSSVVTRLFENKMKGLESDIAKKNISISELKVQLKEANEKLQATQHTVIQLKEQVELLKNVPVEATTDEGLAREYQSVRLANKQLEREKAQLLRQIQRNEVQLGTNKDGPGYTELQEQIKAANNEKKKLQDEVRKLTQELKHFDPTFFEELEDLKFNYNLEVKKNIVLEEQLKKLSDQFGVAIPDVSIN
nr:centrosomal protein of 290 kDa isoform X2 [Danio rerio]|eukprot:XP_005163077.1 centrosomal protein of 290 kDa isoform X2 [Danio rerio]